VAEIPVRPKRGAEIPVEPRRRRNIWPWVFGLLALVLLPLLFMRDNDRDDTAVRSDTAALTDTAGRFGGRTTGTAAGTIAPDTGAAVRANTRTRDTTAGLDTTLRGDTARPTATPTRP
jgi:hypothetical protein